MSGAARQSGVALLVAVWAVALLGALIAGMVATAGSEVSLAANSIEAAKARHLAAAGVRRGILALLDPDERQKLNLSVSAPFQVELADGADITVSVRDSCGKIDLNWSPEPLLHAYATSVGLKPTAAREFATAVAERRTDVPSVENPEDQVPRVGPWQSTLSIVEMEAIGLAELNALLPGLTVNCREPGVDLRFAPEPVRRGVTLAGGGAGVSHELAYEVVSRARSAGGAVATVHASIWLTQQPGRPYRIVEWRGS